MATIRKRGDKWRAEIRMKGHRRSKTFSSKAAAQAWARKIETEIEEALAGTIPNKTFGELLQRYERDVLPKRGSPIREVRVINKLMEDPLSKVPLREITGKDIAAWRDRRLTHVKGSTVTREWNILSAACTVAVKE